MVGFNGISGQVERSSKDDKRQTNRWKKVESRFRGKLVKMIRDVNLMIIQFHLKLEKFYFIGVMSNRKKLFNEFTN